MKYLELGLQNPDLSTTEIALKSLRIKSVENLVGGGSVASERYLWFVDIMLEACESLINYFPTDLWRNTIKYNLRLHKSSIKEIWSEENLYYSPALCEIVDEVLNEDEQLPS